MALAIVTDVSVATMNVSDKINERLEYASILAEILDDYGPGSDLDGGSGSESNRAPESGGDSSDDGESDCAGNPGNNKCVGNAGETPNGKDGWGDGDKGRSK